MGSPDFAIPTLQALAKNYPVAGVVSQPDRPAGRGRKLAPPPVVKLALELGLPVIQPARLKEPAAMAQLQAWQPDLIVVAAFGQILRPAVLELPIHGCLNVHASLLPRWRGAAPIQAAIVHGDSHSGATIMRMDPGLDTGPILKQSATPITPDDTAGSLSDRLAEMGAELLLETLPPYLAGELQPTPQDESLATYAPRLKKSDGYLNFNQSAHALERKVRAFNPWPGASLPWRGQRLKVHQARVVEDQSASPGQRIIHQGLPAVGSAQDLLVLEIIQPPGKRAMPGAVFLRGAHDWVG